MILQRRAYIFTLWCPLLLVLIGQQVLAQTQVRIELSTKTVYAGGVFDVQYIVENGDATNFTPPNFAPFGKSGGPFQSTATTLANGKVQKTFKLSYSLEAPNKSGTYTVPEGTFIINGKSVKTGTKRIQVLAARQKSAQESEYFVRAELSTTEAYVGEQVILTFKLYAQGPISGVNYTRPPDFKGFYYEQLNRYAQYATQEVVDGKPYNAQIIARYALFPQQAGNFVFDPVGLRLSVPMESTGRSFFKRTRAVDVATEGFTLAVQSVPVPFPNNYVGGVGEYSVSVQTSARQIGVDEAVTLILELRGNGDRQLAVAPALDLGDSIEVFSPTLRTERPAEADGELRFTKEFSYLLAPKHQGNYRLQPSISYFNPDSNSFETAQAPPFMLVVGPPTGKGTQQIGELEVPLAATFAWHHKRPHPLQQWWFWVALILPALMSLLIFKAYPWWKARQPEPTAVQKLQKLLRKYNTKTLTDTEVGHLFAAAKGVVIDRLDLPFTERVLHEDLATAWLLQGHDPESWATYYRLKEIHDRVRFAQQPVPAEFRTALAVWAEEMAVQTTETESVDA